MLGPGCGFQAASAWSGSGCVFMQEQTVQFPPQKEFLAAAATV